MMKAIVTFYDGAKKAIIETAQGTNRITWNYIVSQNKQLLIRLSKLKFEKPKQTKEEFKKVFGGLCDEINVAFRNITDK